MSMDSQTHKSLHELSPTEWVEQHGDSLYRYAFSRLRTVDAAEEVVQETFVAALRNSKQFSGTGSEGAWLLGILKRKIVDHVRKRSKVGVQLDSEESGDISEVLFDQSGQWRAEFKRGDFRPLDSLEREEFWSVLRTCLKGLPNRQADVFSLRTLENLSTEEICKDLGITSSNLWVLLYRARTSLANCMRSRW